MNDIHIACALDKGMSVPALILAYSVNKYVSHDRKTIFHVLECEQDAFPSYADHILNSDYFQICRHQVSLDIFKDYDLSIAAVPSLATFARLAIPQIISNAERVLYLDCDVIINRSLDELFDIDMNGFPLAAGRDLTQAYFLRRFNGPHQKAGKILFKNINSYFNAGVLLIDCNKWRNSGYVDSIIKFLGAPPAPLFLADQDALNVVFQDNHLELDPRWNSWAVCYSFGEGEEELVKFAQLCADDPWIIHFIGRAKPWISFHRKTNFHQLYWAVAAESPFLSQLIAAYDAGPLENTAYALRKVPAIYSYRRLWEFFFTLSKAVAKIESALRMKRILSTKLMALGRDAYDKCQELEQAALN
ncbi:MAG TPA: glycosyltransferase family 8 protein [Methylovirgula sp.]